ncbi:TetR/AcrR family transcriptional regulator [Gorillibacterium sp. sgz5001074]|uniref:TetR/AcrR family transcriptional regulator n=1 Tax=Gorillibacterium sp. sgz5001074 TaxID=3446695 RepID=UPI003F662DA6
MEEPLLLHRREHILVEAVQLFDRTGVQGFSTKVLASRLGVSEGTIFKHFRTKTDLFLALIDHYAQYDEDITRTVLLRKLPPLDSIGFYLNAYAEYYGNYPAVTSLLLAEETLALDSGLSDRMNRLHLSRRAFLIFLIGKAVEEGALRGDADREEAADLIFGAMRAIILRWRRVGCAFPLRDAILAALNTIKKAYT